MTNRRAFLSGLALAPVAIVAPAMAAPIAVDTAAWNMALSAVVASHSAMDDYYRDHVRPFIDAHEKGTGTLSTAMEAEDSYDAYVDAYAETVKALMEVPAPTIADIAVKIEWGLRDWVFDGSDEACGLLQKIATDARRLGGSVAA
jgi:hypothetical protein